MRRGALPQWQPPGLLCTWADPGGRAALVRRFLTDKGIEYLREFLNLPADVVPATLKKTARPVGERPRPPMGDRPSRGACVLGVGCSAFSSLAGAATAMPQLMQQPVRSLGVSRACASAGSRGRAPNALQQQACRRGRGGSASGQQGWLEAPAPSGMPIQPSWEAAAGAVSAAGWIPLWSHVALLQGAGSHRARPPARLCCTAGPREGGFGGRDGYRSGRDGDKAGAPGDYAPRFGGGFGRGAPAQ